MVVKLDPFRTISNVSWAAGGITVDIGTITRADQVLTGAPRFPMPKYDQFGGACPRTPNLAGWYWTTFRSLLRSTFQDCAQETYLVRGKTSGITQSFATVDLWANYPQLNCDSLGGEMCDGRSTVYDLIETNKYVEMNLRGIATNHKWESSTQKWTRQSSIYTLNPLNFVKDEEIELTFGGFQQNIVTVTQRELGGIWINLGNHEYEIGCLVDIEGTANYDGKAYVVVSVTSASIAISSVAYVEDETVGIVRANYDGST